MWDLVLSETEEQKKEKRVTLEEVAEETGELIGKGVKKTWSVMKSLGKGLADTIEPKEKQEATASYCPYCGTSLPQESSFCSSCGEKV